jgi:hypothetical protein
MPISRCIQAMVSAPAKGMSWFSNHCEYLLTQSSGFGNIQEDGGRGRDQHKGGVLGNVFRSLSRAASGGRESSRESKKETA